MAIKKKANSKKKKTVARRSKGYIVIHTKRTDGYYSCGSKTKLIICETKASLEKVLMSLGKDILTNKTKSNKTLPMKWTTPTNSITVIEGNVMPVKIETEVSIDLPSEKGK